MHLQTPARYRWEQLVRLLKTDDLWILLLGKQSWKPLSFANQIHVALSSSIAALVKDLQGFCKVAMYRTSCSALRAVHVDMNRGVRCKDLQEFHCTAVCRPCLNLPQSSNLTLNPPAVSRCPTQKQAAGCRMRQYQSTALIHT